MFLGGGWKVTLAEFSGLDVLFPICGGMCDELPKGYGKGINRLNRTVEMLLGCHTYHILYLILPFPPQVFSVAGDLLATGDLPAAGDLLVASDPPPAPLILGPSPTLPGR
ncbi:hypothetical protein TIFTF001_039379 [Ficus carica]|uniref:Uncharacterized protein n=1 Tax=Ficus carica TaxID=3494 RepID=A0AA88E9P9_FICCA|nr:hypothetical protein TIFTF001_039379 [Ficus carica]